MTACLLMFAHSLACHDTVPVFLLELQSHQQLGWSSAVSQVQLKAKGCTSGACSESNWTAPQSCWVQSLIYKPRYMSMLGCQLSPWMWSRQELMIKDSALLESTDNAVLGGRGTAGKQPSQGLHATFHPSPSRWSALWPTWSRRGTSCRVPRDRRSRGG